MTQEELNEKIGKNVRKYRLLYNAKIGVSTPLIGALESTNSRQGVSIYNLFQISKILNTPIEKFFE